METTIVYWGYRGLYWDNGKKMETTILSYWDYIGFRVILGLYWVGL